MALLMKETCTLKGVSASDISLHIYIYIYIYIYYPYDLLVDQLIGELRGCGPLDNVGRASIAIRELVYSSIG